MRFLPLIWAAVMRKPVRTILTLLSVMVAFTLFGITIGMNATFDKVAASAHDDRIFTNQRFFGTGMPRAQAGQTAQLPGIAQVAYFDVLSGYHENQRNRAFALMRTGDKVLCHRFAHFLRRIARRPLAQVILLRAEHSRSGPQKECHSRHFQH